MSNLSLWPGQMVHCGGGVVLKLYFTHGRFPEVGQKQKTEKKEERKKERLNDGNNNGQATHGARKHACRTQAAWAKND